MVVFLCVLAFTCAKSARVDVLKQTKAEPQRQKRMPQCVNWHRVTYHNMDASMQCEDMFALRCNGKRCKHLRETDRICRACTARWQCFRLQHRPSGPSSPSRPLLPCKFVLACTAHTKNAHKFWCNIIDHRNLTTWLPGRQRAGFYSQPEAITQSRCRKPELCVEESREIMTGHHKPSSSTRKKK
jgi:hypothetical protein